MAGPPDTLIVFDGDCVLCTGFFHFVLRHDQAQIFRFLTAQSARGEALYAEYGLKSKDYDTNIVILNGRLYTKCRAFLAVMYTLSWPWRALTLLRLIPRPLADWGYDRIARNRFALFGRRDTCMIPTPDLKARFLD